MNEDARCTEARGDVQRPWRAERPTGRAGLGADGRDVRSGHGKVTFTDQDLSAEVTYTAGAGTAFGKESWKWLLLQPLMPQQ